MRHIINLQVENQSGVLARIAGLFSARGFNIESLSVGKMDSEAASHMTLVVRGDDWIIEQVIKQLNKLIDVYRVTDVTSTDFVGRELVLVKVYCPPAKRGDISQLVQIFRAKVVDISNRSMTLELTGNEPKIEAFLETLQPFGIQEIARTGSIAMVRDSNGKM
ncbi:MAG TPA: acetolactate synthase small subunit [bacterium]|jgi:acetolactate synthase-1/3 small subunit|nr:acetolactate synthase small subunit [bacterium]HNT64901.1 acetolactate synthase small subunit [bacterium]HOX84932.1 acetolactate synthase small subunit [bacterium]HPG44202.1 acetolactate synthase small subunit [bacterium]HPM96569.1 acetolactate synthase small subunit [bacterium]